MTRAQKIGKGIERDARRWKRVQAKMGLKPTDGWPGNQFLGELERRLGILVETPAPKPPDQAAKQFGAFPAPDYASMVRFYGRPGDESNLIRIRFPYRMRLYSRDAPATVTGHRVHRKCAATLLEVLTDLLETHGHEWIVKHGLDVFGGIYNDRSVRNGRAKSKHAWGAAIDLNPAENQNRQRWSARNIGKPGWANMPLAAIRTFKRHGWKSLGETIGRDAMHFQATL